MARALAPGSGSQGRPHGRNDDAAGRALGQLRAASDLQRHPGHAPARYRSRGRRARPRARRRVIDPTPTGTVKRPSADLRPSPRAGSSFGPSSRPVDDTTRGSLDAGRRTHRCPRPFPYEAFSDESAPFPGRRRCLKSCSLAAPSQKVLGPAGWPGQADRWSSSEPRRESATTGRRSLVSRGRRLPDSGDNRSGRGRADALRTDRARQRVPLPAGTRGRLARHRDDGPEGPRPAGPWPRAGAGRRRAAGVGHRSEAHAGPRGRSSGRRRRRRRRPC